jgi:hypothetical protein
MICGQETKDDISSILDLTAAPHTDDKWAERVYTCTYHLPDGPLVISVKESPDPAAARKYFDSLQGKLDGATPIKGLANLGFAAAQTDNGSVVFPQGQQHPVRGRNTAAVRHWPAKGGPHRLRLPGVHHHPGLLERTPLTP